MAGAQETAQPTSWQFSDKKGLPPDSTAVMNRSLPLRIVAVNGIDARAGELHIAKRSIRQAQDDPLLVIEAENYRDVFWQGVEQETTSSEDLMNRMEAHSPRIQRYGRVWRQIRGTRVLYHLCVQSVNARRI